MNLFELGRKHNAVKCYDKFKYSWSFCKEIYPHHFGDRRDKINTLLEIGVHQGGSLRMWEEYFPTASIYGIDTIDSFKDKGRIRFRCGDQADIKFLNEVTNEVGSWDIVIDDGSHKFKHQKVTFETLWPRVSAGGIYVIEDVMERHPESIPLIDYLCDLMKKELTKLTKDTSEETGTDIKRISFYPKLIVVEKV